MQQSGNPLTDNEVITQHYTRMQTLQLVAFKKFQPELLEIASLNIAAIDTRESLMEQLGKQTPKLLRNLCEALGLVPGVEAGHEMEQQILLSVLVNHHERRTSRKQQAQELPLYPTEVRTHPFAFDFAFPLHLPLHLPQHLNACRA